MAGFVSDSGSEFNFDLTASDEELLWAAADRLSSPAPQSQLQPKSRQAPDAPATPATPATPAPRRNTTQHAFPSSPFSPRDPDAILVVEEALAAISDDDLSFDVSELLEEEHQSPTRHGQHSQHGQHRQVAAHGQYSIARSRSPEGQSRRLAPSVARTDGDLASFVSKSKPRSMPTLLPGPDVQYPDCTLFSAFRSPRAL